MTYITGCMSYWMFAQVENEAWENKIKKNKKKNNVKKA